MESQVYEKDGSVQQKNLNYVYWPWIMDPKAYMHNSFAKALLPHAKSAYGRQFLLIIPVLRFPIRPGLYKIFDEILVNAADNFVRDNSQTYVKAPTMRLRRSWKLEEKIWQFFTKITMNSMSPV